MKILLSVIFASVVSLAVGAYGGYEFYKYVGNQVIASLTMGSVTSQTIAHHKIGALLEEKKYDEAKRILSNLVEIDIATIHDLSSQVESGPNKELAKVAEENKLKLQNSGIKLEPNKSSMDAPVKQ